MRFIAFLTVLVLALVLLSPLSAQTPPATRAASGQSCGRIQSICAARCKTRAPTDTNCVADHCTPKLEECLTTGCWQEGRLYGGKLTCNLVKSRR
ncbi:MAG: hypothetical protein K2X10_04585 [Hyphomicrobiales bacterium]|nr:hypothetical protein [Hyphomicrobiales bacterium]